MLRGALSEEHFKIRTLRNGSMQPNYTMNGHNSNIKPTNKDKKKNKQANAGDITKKKHKKKRSFLSFWFCMGTKTDQIDKENDLKPYPAQKSKQKVKKSQSSSDVKSSPILINDTYAVVDKEKKNARRIGSRRYRFSAPPADWVALMTSMEDLRTSQAASETESKQGQRSRSKSPGGVRYRFDGTLEKPYVYPGGLTFVGESARKIRRGKKSSKRGSKKKGEDVNGILNNTTEAEIHHTDDDGDDDDDYIDGDFDDSDEDSCDESDISKQFYLRYDSHVKTKRRSRKDNRRYSVPAELNLRGRDMEQREMGHDHAKHDYRKHNKSDSDYFSKNDRKQVVNIDSRNDEKLDDEEEYDEPYEGSGDEEDYERQRHLMAHNRPTSYYSPPSPERNDFVYMWHSCEDIRQCNEHYHSEQEIRNSKQELAQNTQKYDQNSDQLSEINGLQGNRSLVNQKHHKDGESRDILSSRNPPDHSNSKSNKPLSKSSSKSPVPPKRNVESHNNILFSRGQPSDNSYEIKDNDSNAYNHLVKSTSPVMSKKGVNVHETSANSDEVFTTNYHAQFHQNDQLWSTPTHYSDGEVPSSKRMYSKNSSSPSSPIHERVDKNPFRRNLGRSSCMPGNKRFFIPPPPCYTPPREELELAREKMVSSDDSNKENKENSNSDVIGESKSSDLKSMERYSRGSQTDLTDDNQDEALDMEERDRRSISLDADFQHQENDKDLSANIYSKPSPITKTKQTRIDKEPIYDNAAPLKKHQGKSLFDCNNPPQKPKQLNHSHENKSSLKDDSICLNDKNHSKRDNNRSSANAYHLPPTRWSVCDPYIDDTNVYINMLPQPAPLTTPYTPSQRHKKVVVTSTPKTKRRSELTTPRKPVPTPRQRFSSCLEYSTIQLPSTSPTKQNADDKSESNNPKTQPSSKSTCSKTENSHSPHLLVGGASTKLMAPTIAKPQNIRPVAKRRSLIPSCSDSSFSHKDIDNVPHLEDKFNSNSMNPSLLPSENKSEEAISNHSRIKNNEIQIAAAGRHENPVKKELCPKNLQSPPRTGEKINESENAIVSSTKSKSVDVRKDDRNNNDSGSSVSISDVTPSSNDSSKSGGENNFAIQDNNHKEITRISQENTVFDSFEMPPLAKLKMNVSPTDSNRRFSGLFSSSVDCLLTTTSAPLSKETRSYYRSISASSLGDIPGELTGRARPFSNVIYPYDVSGEDDDADDESADDEMSVHNEDIGPLRRTPSLEDLLRARSTLSRSQAVCRKRRQRMRDRKCQSQILSSTEVDDFYQQKEAEVKRKLSRHSSKQKQKHRLSDDTQSFTQSQQSTHYYDVNSPQMHQHTQPPHHENPENVNPFIFKDDQAIPQSAAPVSHSRRVLYRQARLLNHTDSGMDSDGTCSPFNSRDFNQQNILINNFNSLSQNHYINNNLNTNRPMNYHYNQNLQNNSSHISNFHFKDHSSTQNCYHNQIIYKDNENKNNQNQRFQQEDEEEYNRFYDRHRLKTARSREFMSSGYRTSQHLDKNVSVSNGFETLV